MKHCEDSVSGNVYLPHLVRQNDGRLGTTCLRVGRPVCFRIRHVRHAGGLRRDLHALREAQGEDSRQVRETVRHPKEVEGRGRDREARRGGEAVG